MNNQFTTYEIAVKLKELGFNEKCLYSIEYSEGGQTLYLNPNFKNNSQSYIGEITLPLWQQAINWIRREKGIDLCVNKAYDDLWEYSYNRVGDDTTTITHVPLPTECSLEDAYKECILAAIKLIEKK